MKKALFSLLVAVAAASAISAQAQVTVDFQFLNDAGGAVPVYTGTGVPGFGTGHYWNTVPDPNDYYGAGTFASTNSLADDGTTDTGIIMTMVTGGNYSSPPGVGSISLLDSYAATTTSGSFTFTNVPSGTYNLVLFGANGTYHGNANKFTVNSVSLSATNNSDTAFILDDNYVVFSNLVVTTGQIAGTWAPTVAGAEGDMDGAQLQQVSLSNPAPAFSPNPPTVTPANALYAGANVTLATKVSGNTPLHLRWQVNKGTGFTNFIASATNATLNLAGIKVSDAGTYRLAATNSVSGTVSQPVVLTVDGSQQAFTINYQWNSSENGPVPIYHGPGVPGYGTGTFWNTVPGPAAWNPGVYASTNSLADDGVTDEGITWTLATGGSSSSTPGTGSIYLLDSYADAENGNVQTFEFNPLPAGNYNLVLFGDNGTYHGDNITTYTVNSTSLNLTNNFTDNAFIQNVTYVVFSNIAVTGAGGTLAGTWQGQVPAPSVQAEGNLNGAQLQLVGPVVNTVTVTITPLAGGQVQLSWPQGTLMQSSVLGSGASWSAVPGVSGTTYTTSTTGTQMYYRVQVSP